MHLNLAYVRKMDVLQMFIIKPNRKDEVVGGHLPVLIKVFGNFLDEVIIQQISEILGKKIEITFY